MSQTGNEIINITIGNAGNNIGNAWLTEILKEHKLDESGAFTGNQSKDVSLLQRINSYFYERGHGILSQAYIRQEIQCNYRSLSIIPDDVKKICKQYMGKHYKSRSIIINTDPSMIDSIKQSHIQNIFNERNFVTASTTKQEKDHCTWYE